MVNRLGTHDEDLLSKGPVRSASAPKHYRSCRRAANYFDPGISLSSVFKGNGWAQSGRAEGEDEMFRVVPYFR